MLDKERTLLNEATVVIFIVENEHVKGDSLQRQMPIHGRGRLWLHLHFVLGLTDVRFQVVVVDAWPCQPKLSELTYGHLK